jgi:hypothetical protein
LLRRRRYDEPGRFALCYQTRTETLNPVPCYQHEIEGFKKSIGELKKKALGSADGKGAEGASGGEKGGGSQQVAYAEYLALQKESQVCGSSIVLFLGSICTLTYASFAAFFGDFTHSCLRNAQGVKRRLESRINKLKQTSLEHQKLLVAEKAETKRLKDRLGAETQQLEQASSQLKAYRDKAARQGSADSAMMEKLVRLSGCQQRLADLQIAFERQKGQLKLARKHQGEAVTKCVHLSQVCRINIRAISGNIRQYPGNRDVSHKTNTRS